MSRRPSDSRRLILALGLGACVAATGAQAQSTSITFTNTSPPVVIPLKDGSAVNIGGDGNLVAQCQPNPQGGCVGATSGGTKADVLSFQRNDSDPEITAGESISLAWTSANAVLCNATANPGVSGWSGLKPASSSGSSVQLSNQGNQTLSLTCYNEHGSTGTKSVAVQVGAPTGPVLEEVCTGMTGHELVKPAGFTIYDKTWPQAFYGNQYPSTGAPLAPLGSFTLKGSGNSGVPIAGRYISIPFVPGSGTYKINWLQVQPISDYSYGPARPAEKVYITLSTCRGDFRLPDNNAGDPLLRTACRKIHSSTSIFYSTSTSGFNTCGLQAGQQYYLNVMFADPFDGLTTTENTCLGGNTMCEVNFRHELQSN